MSLSVRPLLLATTQNPRLGSKNKETRKTQQKNSQKRKKKTSNLTNPTPQPTH